MTLLECIVFASSCWNFSTVTDAGDPRWQREATAGGELCVFKLQLWTFECDDEVDGWKHDSGFLEKLTDDNTTKWTDSWFLQVLKTFPIKQKLYWSLKFLIFVFSVIIVIKAPPLFSCSVASDRFWISMLQSWSHDRASCLHSINLLVHKKTCCRFFCFPVFVPLTENNQTNKYSK